MSHCRLENLLSAYVDGELSGHAAQDLERHLESCQHCASVLELVQFGEKALRQALPEMQPPAHIKAQLFRRIDSEPENRRLSDFLALFRLSFKPRAWAYACAPILLFAVIISAIHVRQGVENGRILAEIDRSRAALATRPNTGNPFSIDVNGAPLRFAGKNPFEAYLNGR